MLLVGAVLVGLGVSQWRNPGTRAEDIRLGLASWWSRHPKSSENNRRLLGAFTAAFGLLVVLLTALSLLTST